MAQVALESGMETYTVFVEPKDEPPSATYRDMALLMVVSSSALLESLADLICSAGFIVITTTADRMERTAITMTSSIRVKELGFMNLKCNYFFFFISKPNSLNC